MIPRELRIPDMELVQVAQRIDGQACAVAFYEGVLGTPVVAQFEPPGLVGRL